MDDIDKAEGDLKDLNASLTIQEKRARDVIKDLKSKNLIDESADIDKLSEIVQDLEDKNRMVKALKLANQIKAAD